MTPPPRSSAAARAEEAEGPDDTGAASSAPRRGTRSPGRTRRPPAPRALTRPVDDPSLFLDRELSLLAFNHRVLAQAADPATPLLERLRFLAISSSNLDEFFEIRVSGLKEQVALGLPHHAPHGMTAEEVLGKVSEAAHALVDDQYRLLNDALLPALAAEGVNLVQLPDASVAVTRWVKRYFAGQLLPVLTPMGLDPAHPFPRILNKSLNFLVTLEGRDAFGRQSRMAVVQAPRALPRLIQVPPRVSGRPHDFLLLSSVIRHHVHRLFPGMRVTGCHAFRVTRNSDLWVDEEEVDDLLHALAGELPRRNYGHAVRLEVSRDCPEDVVRLLQDRFHLDPDDLYRVDGPVNLHRLSALTELARRPDLLYRPFVPSVPRDLAPGTDLFARLREGSRLLHHPFQSFAPVLSFLRQAADDPKVVAIKMTLYRTGADSPVVDALIDAARAGKEVTVVVELRARFDEAANIDLATRLQDAGALVVYGIVGYKCHAKMLLVVRREGRRLKRYVHLGTGNYHSGTARLYTDLGYLTAHPEFGQDVQRLFQQLTGLGKATRLERLVQSPFELHKTLLAHIDAVAQAAREGKPARILARMNALSEQEVVRALYRASQAGARIDLLVRGVCCLRPGVPGVSETIRVRSVVDRFLEHSRVFHFQAGDRKVTYLSSADWMSRNLERRVETAFPVEEPELERRVLRESLEVYFEDNASAWVLGADGKWTRRRPGRRKVRRAQQVLLERLT